MRPDEWRQGMENEAASVADEGWARETKRSVWLIGGRPLAHDLLLTVGASLLVSAYILTTQVLIGRAAFYMD